MKSSILQDLSDTNIFIMQKEKKELTKMEQLIKRVFTRLGIEAVLDIDVEMPQQITSYDIMIQIKQMGTVLKMISYSLLFFSVIYLYTRI